MIALADGVRLAWTRHKRRRCDGREHDNRPWTNPHGVVLDECRRCGQVSWTIHVGTMMPQTEAAISFGTDGPVVTKRPLCAPDGY